jgi:hypothetical protein
MFKMVSYDLFGHLKHKLWLKKGPRIKLAIWLPTTKSQESTQILCVQVACYISLESSWWELQLCFRIHLNWTFARKVMWPQNHKSPSLVIWSPETKCHLDVGLVERHKVHYKGEGGDFPQARAVVSLVNPSLPVTHPSTKIVPTMH